MPQAVTGWAPAPETQTTPGWTPAPETQSPPGYYLGASAKPAQLIGPPAYGEVIRQSIPSLFGAGAAAGALALGQPELMPAAAALGGWTGKAVQQAVRAAGWGPPPSLDPVVRQSERIGSATTQMGAELLGPAVAWPLQKIGGKLLGESIATRAGRALEADRLQRETEIHTALQAGQDLLTRSRAARSEALQTVGERGAADLRQARRVAAQGIRTARSTARTGRETAAAPPVLAVSHAQDQLANLPPPAASHQQVGRQVVDVVQGPAKDSLSQLGEAVGEAAETGGMVKTQPVKDKISQMLKDFTPTTRDQPLADPTAVSTLYKETFGGGSNLSTADQLATLKRVGLELAPGHPLPGLLGEISALPEEISLRDAHIFKGKLDKAVNWDKVSASEVGQMSKGTRIALRESMRGHAPYDTATVAYEKALPLFREGIAGEIPRLATENPGQLVRMIKPTEGVKLQMLHDVLVQQGGPEGQAAWNNVRSHVVSDTLIAGDVTKLSQRLASMEPEFAGVLGQEADGQMVLEDLHAIAEAVDRALAQGKQRVLEATTQGRMGIEQAQQAGEGLVAAAQRRVAARTSVTQTASRQAVAQRAGEVRQLQQRVAEIARSTPAEESLAGSSLAAARPPSDVAREVVHAMLTHNYWRASAIARLLKGPQASELVHWASYSPARTQMWVKAVTGPEPGAMLANVARIAGIRYVQGREQPGMAVSHTRTLPPPSATTPPPPR